ncbi:Acetylcholinesterase-1 [Halotydeus destructor]|nr:Acetylcholinesterase-1 [Halotydeus destructor]
MSITSSLTVSDNYLTNLVPSSNTILRSSASHVKVNLNPTPKSEKDNTNYGLLIVSHCFILLAFTLIVFIMVNPNLQISYQDKDRVLPIARQDPITLLESRDKEREFSPPDVSHEPEKNGGFVVITKSGPVRGMAVDVLGRTVHAYLGIPFAKPPIGDRRFKRPEPVSKWRGIYAAIDFSDPCVQYRPGKIHTPWISDRSNGSEDCLYLNIWSPGDRTKLKTVMVWFHGGAFFSGSADVDLYHGDHLAAHGDVVIVSLNYRLGALGFLNAGTDQYGGNMGLYDQLMALNWIKDNIDQFGGDPESLVLFGQSAGATSAGLHLFSPLSRSIAKRVILQSGGPLFPKNYFENSMDKSNEFAVQVGCAGNNVSDIFSQPEDVIACLQSKTVDQLVIGHGPLFKKYKIPFFPRPGDDFLPELPHESILDPDALDGQTDIMMGSTADEGSFFMHLFFPEFFQNDMVNSSLSPELAKHFVAEAYSFIPERQAKMMSQFFLGSLTANSSADEVLTTTYNVVGDSGFVCPAVHMSEILAEYNMSVYHYFFTHRPSNTRWGQWFGSTHLDEVDFIFGGPLRKPDMYTKEEVALSKRNDSYLDPVC